MCVQELVCECLVFMGLDILAVVRRCVHAVQLWIEAATHQLGTAPNAGKACQALRSLLNAVTQQLATAILQWRLKSLRLRGCAHAAEMYNLCVVNITGPQRCGRYTLRHRHTHTRQAVA